MAATGYQLLVYGNKRQDEVYCAKCERLIKKLGMQDHVFIMGLAKPAEILRQGWIYLQVRLFQPLTPPRPKLPLPPPPHSISPCPKLPHPLASDRTDRPHDMHVCYRNLAQILSDLRAVANSVTAWHNQWQA